MFGYFAVDDISFMYYIVDNEVTMFVYQLMVVGVPGKMKVNVLNPVEEVSRNKFVIVIVQHHTVMGMNVKEKQNDM